MSWTPPFEADLSPWSISTDDWWAWTSWVAQSYPSLLRLGRKVFQQVGSASSPSDAGAIERDLLPLLSSRPGACGPELAALRDYIGRLRRAHSDAGLERFELALVTLDATNRFLAGNPFVEAVDAMQWQRVPPEHAGFAVDLGLLARLWRIGRNDVPKPHEDMAVGLRRVVAIVQRVAGVMGDLEWPRELHRATHAATHKQGARWMGGGWAYLFEMLGRLPQTDPRNLAIYEALADEASEDSRASVEHAIAAFVEALGSPQLAASTALRSAIRRMVRGDEEAAFDQGKVALERMAAVGDPRGACCAAVLLGWVRRHDASELARWLELALRWAPGHETTEVQLALLGVLISKHEETGNDIGQRRVLEQARKLLASDPETWQKLSDMWDEEEEEPEPDSDDSDEPEREAGKPPTRAESTPLPPAFEEIGRELRREAFTTAYAMFGAYIGDLLESHDEGTVVRTLRGHVAALDDRLSIAQDLVKAWLCSAVTDLVEDDHEVWCTAKALQLDLEDRLGVTEELIMAGARPKRRSFLLGGLLLDNPFALAPFGEQWALDPRGRAMQCIAEAEQAMQRGQAQRARFWVERAQRYRKLMDEA